MTKNKRLVSRMMFTLLVLTLVSLCCVGFTFARYTSSASGTAKAEVAKWDITFATEKDSGSTTLTVGKLSPSQAAYNETAPTQRTNSTDAIKVATITNKSDVAAIVTLAEDTTKFDATGAVETATTGKVLKSDVQDVITISFTYSTDGGATKNAIPTNGIPLAAATDENGVSVEIYATITWTTDVGFNASYTKTMAEAADARDTLIGQTVTDVTFGITYTAVQNSKLPA